MSVEVKTKAEAIAPRRTFLAELDRQCARIVWFAISTACVVWLPYIPSDMVLHPEARMILWLRAGFSAIGVLMLIVKLTINRAGVSLFLLIVFGFYVEISGAVITALTKADSVYVGGYILLLMLVPLGPMPRAAGWSMLAASVLAFAGTLFTAGGGFEGERGLYSLKDLVTASVISAVFTYFTDRLRKRSWQSVNLAVQGQLEAEEATRRAESAREQAQLARAESEKLTELTQILLAQVEEQREIVTRKEKKARTLAELGRQANESRSIDEVLYAAARIASAEFGADKLMLYLVNRERTRLVLKSVVLHGEHRDLVTYPLEAREIPVQSRTTIAYRTMQRMRPFFIPVIRAQHLADLPEARMFLSAMEPAWLLVLPLIVNSEVEGLITVAGEKPLKFSAQDRFFAQSVASQIAGMIRILRISDEKEKMATIGDMAAGIVHDLKNPVSIIKGSVEMAEDPASSASERTELHSIIDREADRMLSLVQDLLDFSRGSVSIQTQEMNVAAYLERLRTIMGPLFGGRGVHLHIEAEAGLTVRIDPARFLRALVNIASNAADVLSPGTGRFSIKAFRRDASVLFTLHDNGPGIPEHVQSGLFKPFVTHGKAHGTGLGMAIARSMVEAHGGRISFVTGTGEGTTFSIEVPA